MTKFKGSPEELMAEIDGLAFSFVGLINQAEDYELKGLDAAGVWFVLGQAFSLLHHAKRLLEGEPSKDVAKDWRAVMDFVTVSKKTVKVLADVTEMTYEKGGYSKGDWPDVEKALAEAGPLVKEDEDEQGPGDP